MFTRALGTLALVALLFSPVPVLAHPDMGVAARPAPEAPVRAEDLDLSGLVQKRDKVTRAQEAELENTLQRLADRLFDPGKALVRVKLELDFTRRSTRHHLMAPVTGSDGKIVQAPANAGKPGGAAFNVQDEASDLLPGAIKRMSVLVVVPPELKDAQIDRVRRIFAAAAGSDATRRDQVTVEPYRLAPLPTPEPKP